MSVYFCFRIFVQVQASQKTETKEEAREKKIIFCNLIRVVALIRRRIRMIINHFDLDSHFPKLEELISQWSVLRNKLWRICKPKMLWYTMERDSVLCSSINTALISRQYRYDKKVDPRLTDCTNLQPDCVGFTDSFANFLMQSLKLKKLIRKSIAQNL